MLRRTPPGLSRWPALTGPKLLAKRSHGSSASCQRRHGRLCCSFLPSAKIVLVRLDLGFSHRASSARSSAQFRLVSSPETAEHSPRAWFCDVVRRGRMRSSRLAPAPGPRKRGLRTAARREPYCIGGVAALVRARGTPESQLQHEARKRHSKEWKMPPRRRDGRVERRRRAPELPSAHQMAVCTSEGPLPFVNVTRWAFDRP